MLDLAVPSSGTIHSEQDLLNALGDLSPHLLTYFMSFMTLGIFWVGQQTQLNHFARSNRNLAWIHLGFLLAVTLTPFSTKLLAQFPNRISLVVYWLNILLLGIMLFASWRYGFRAGLLKEEATPEVRAAAQRRIFVAQALYTFAALLAVAVPNVITTYVSIAFIVLVQLNYVIAPKIRPLYRL